jgi:DNA-directed RNA polymerase specialized sigma24 family protein
MQLHATRLLGDRALAEDVVHEGIDQVGDTGGGDQREVSLRGWLLTVVHNSAIDRIRLREARPPRGRGIPSPSTGQRALRCRRRVPRCARGVGHDLVAQDKELSLDVGAWPSSVSQLRNRSKIR